MEGLKTLMVPRGLPNLAPLTLDMTLIYEAENRLFEVSLANPSNAAQLQGYFNNACNLTTKYLAWIEYEILNAKKHFDLAKATVILEKSIEEWNKIKSSGVKYNEDFREAMVSRDSDCQLRLDTLNALIASKSLLESKVKSFTRAYYTCQSVSSSRGNSAGSSRIGGNIGQTFDEPQANFMGSYDNVSVKDEE